MFPARQTKTKRCQRQKGAAIVEFTLSFLLFVMLSIGLFEMARAMWVWTTLSHAVRQGARYAMVHGNSSPVADTSIVQLVKKQVIGLNPSSVTVSVNWENNATKAGGEFVEVRAIYPFQFVTGPALISEPIDLGSVSRMTIAY